MDPLNRSDEAESGRSGRPGLFLLVGAAVVLAGSAGAWRLLRRPAPLAPQQQTPRRPPPEPKAANGTLEIDSRPEGARVTVDGQTLGNAPQRAELRGGSHQVAVRLDGFEPFLREVHIVPGHTLRLAAELKREAPRLSVDADVPGAKVFLDHQPIGSTPLTNRTVSPGSHRLNVTADGYEMYAETIEVASGTRQVMVRFKEVQLDETLRVVHKHGIGSCRGRLHATVLGLRYETSSSDDTFELPFTRLEPLQVDYAGKTLRVKVRGGRTYNFTAEGADTLLAFRNVVESARRRLQ